MTDKAAGAPHLRAGCYSPPAAVRAHAAARRRRRRGDDAGVCQSARDVGPHWRRENGSHSHPVQNTNWTNDLAGYMCKQENKFIYVPRALGTVSTAHQAVAEAEPARRSADSEHGEAAPSEVSQHDSDGDDGMPPRP